MKANHRRSGPSAWADKSRSAANRASRAADTVRGTWIVLGTLVLIVGLCGVPGARAAESAAQQMTPAENANCGGGMKCFYDGQIHPWHVQGNVWLMAGEPGESNVEVQVGPDGALVVDTGVGSMAKALLAAINHLAASKLDYSGQHALGFKPIHIIIDTDGLADHVGGNVVLREGGNSLVTGNARAGNPNFNPGAEVWANQGMLNYLLAHHGANGQPLVPYALWPSQTRSENPYSITYNGEAVILDHPPRAGTNGDTMVMFRGSNVLAAGDVLSMTGYPIIDVKRGGTIDGELVALNRIIDMTVPGPYEQGGTLVIPGHGRVCDQAGVVDYRNMITQIRDRVQYYKNEGKTLEEVLALDPTLGSEPRWGHKSGPWTTRDFLTAVYDTLPRRGPRFTMRREFVVPGTGAGHGAQEVF